MKKRKFIFCLTVLVLCMLCVSALATEWSGSHNTGEPLNISVGDYLMHSFGLHGFIYISGDYTANYWADWGTGWGTRHGVYQVTSFSQSGSTVRIGVKKVYLDGYDNDDCVIAPAYSWEGDQCTARKVCSRCGAESEKETVTGVYVKDTAATVCGECDTGHYEAVFTNPDYEKQCTAPNSVSDNKPLQHIWTGKYSWEGDQCTARKVCSRCSTESEKETVTGVYVKDTAATVCGECDTGHYEAVFTNPDYEKQCTAPDSVSDNKPLQHMWTGNDYVWVGDRCVLTEHCMRNYNHIYTLSVQGNYVKDADAADGMPEQGHLEAFINNWKQCTQTRSSVTSTLLSAGDGWYAEIIEQDMLPSALKNKAEDICLYGYLRALTDAENGPVPAKPDEEITFTLKADAGLTFFLLDEKGNIATIETEYDEEAGEYRIPYMGTGYLFAE